MKEMRTTTIRVHEPQAYALDVIAKAQGVKPADVIRTAIAEFIGAQVAANPKIADTLRQRLYEEQRIEQNQALREMIGEKGLRAYDPDASFESGVASAE